MRTFFKKNKKKIHIVCLFVLEEKLNLVGHKEVCAHPPSTTLMMLALHRKKMAHWKIFKCDLLREEKGKKRIKTYLKICITQTSLLKKTKEIGKESKDQG